MQATAPGERLRRFTGKTFGRTTRRPLGLGVLPGPDDQIFPDSVIDFPRRLYIPAHRQPTVHPIARALERCVPSVAAPYLSCDTCSLLSARSDHRITTTAAPAALIAVSSRNCISYDCSWIFVPLCYIHSPVGRRYYPAATIPPAQSR